MLTESEFKRIFKSTGFPAPREFQRETIEKAIKAFEDGKKYVIIQAPTGIGKSAISISIANYFGNAFFATSQKILQTQYAQDFKVPYVNSKANYECLHHETSCNLCMKKIRGEEMCEDCPYIEARNIAFSSKICDLNYAYLFSMIGAMREQFFKLASQRELMVCDECHNLPDELIKRGTITITEDEFNDYQSRFGSAMKMKLPDFSKMDYRAIIDWLRTIYNPFVHEKAKEYTSKLSNVKKHTNIKYYRALNSVLEYYTQQGCFTSDLFDMHIDKGFDVFITKTKKSLTIKPFHAYGFFNMLRPYSKRFLFMSASILDKDEFCHELGLKPELTEYISLDSPFPVQNRKIFFTPVGSMSWKNKGHTISSLVNRVDAILTKFKDQKGIIHTGNYEIAQRIIDGLKGTKNGSRFVMPMGADRQKQLDDFYKSKNPLVLISPSLMEGVDLKDDRSRFSIICKVPYMSLGDNWVVQKMRKNPKWYYLKTAEKLIQETGRSIRSKTDYAFTFVLDKDFERFVTRNKKMLPEWWFNSIMF